MTQAFLMHRQSYSDDYASEGVSDTAIELQRMRRAALADSSVTIGHRYNLLFHHIVEARAAADHEDWDSRRRSLLFHPLR